MQHVLLHASATCSASTGSTSGRQLLGLGERSGIDLPNEIKGLVPSTEWKRQTTGEQWYPGETISVSIGQGQVSVTPMSLAVMMMTVANGGTRYTPHVLKAIEEGDQDWKPVPPPPPQSRCEDEGIDDRGAARRAVDGRERRGNRRPRTDRRLQRRREDGHRAGHVERGREGAARARWTCATTGGSSFSRRTTSRRSPASIFAEHAEHGYLGAPIAKFAMETYFAKKEGRPLPSSRSLPAPVWPSPPRIN